jgi:LmbE family N-acetylglucosaminyl deacetylase
VTVVHLAPHPDDEALAAIATLLALRDAGRRVVNVACGLGSDPARRDERRAEAEEACRRAAFELVLLDGTLADALAALEPELVIGPAPTDAHPAHAAVGEALLGCLPELGVPVWQWSLWSDLPRPTLYVPFGEDLLARARHVLAAHAGELARTDYDALLHARGVAGRVLGAERVFGFGTAPPGDEPYAEVFCERLPPAYEPAPPRRL